MATKRNRKKNLKILILVAIIVVVLFLIALIVLKNKNKTMTPEQIAKIEQKHEEERNEEIVKDLYNKPEQERMQYYCGEFFKLIDSKNYDKAYSLLYSDYKENYFPNIYNFKKYFQDYFPSDFGLSYSNIERLGDIYVLNVNVKDTLNGSYGKNFDMYVVLKENALNDYVISFSRNSAVRGEE